jgi:hypothetical protein
MQPSEQAFVTPLTLRGSCDQHHAYPFSVEALGGFLSASSRWSTASRISYSLWRKHYTGGSGARLRAFWHHVLRGYALETCGECGRPVGVAWVAEHDLWLEIMGHEGGLLCIRCFDAALECQGRFVRWVPEVNDAAPSDRAASVSASR